MWRWPRPEFRIWRSADMSAADAHDLERPEAV